MRHGKSDWSVDATDFDRPLNRRGERDAQSMGGWMKQQQWIPDWVITSPALRARNSAARCCREFATAGGVKEREMMAVHYRQKLYEASSDNLLSQLQRVPESAKRVLVVGHNPGLESLVRALSDLPVSLPKHGKLFPTAALAHFVINSRWKKIKTGKGCLQSLHYPKDISSDISSKKHSGGAPVPAHFFTQSGVIPYRYLKGERQGVLVTSSHGGHWIFPKGVVELDLTPEQSATREALEEAGIEGKIKGEAVGHYYHKKWGGVCTITLYPMLVSRILKQRNWQESERQRRWFSIDDACQRIDNPGLRALLENF